MNKYTIDKEKRTRLIANELNIVYLRWILLIVVIPLYIYAFQRQIGIYFGILFVFLFVYNFINQILLVNNRYLSRWFSLNTYIDIAFISALIATDGGYFSGLFVGYYIVMVYEGIKKNHKNPILLGIIVAIIYSLIVFNLPRENMNIWEYVFRNIFILLSALFVSEITHQFIMKDKLHKKDRDLARKDKVTGLYNTNFLEKMLNEDIAECVNQKSCLCILLFEIDNFKTFEEMFSHSSANDLLRYFAKVVLETVPSNTKAFRYSSEQFLIVLKDIDIHEAYKISEVIRRKFASSNIFVRTEVGRKKITVSCGLACCPEHSTGYFDLLDYVSKALTEAKIEGRNRVVVAEREY